LGSASPYPAAQVSSGATFDDIVVTAAAINTVVGNAAGTIEQWSQLALLNSRGWGVNQYLSTFTARNIAHVVGKGSVVATVALDVFDPSKTILATGRDAGVGFVAVFGGPVGAIGAGAYFTIDTFYPGGVEIYGADYFSVCAQTGC
jgi:hypothetical protein